MSDIIRAYFILRKDLGLSPGKLAAQVGHGCDAIHLLATGSPWPAEGGRELEPRDVEFYRGWTGSGRRKIVVSVAGERELASLIELLRTRGVAFSAIDDLGLTELPGPTRTGVVLLPAPESITPGVVRHLPLWR